MYVQMHLFCIRTTKEHKLAFVLKLFSHFNLPQESLVRQFSSIRTSVRRSYWTWSTNSTQIIVWTACWSSCLCQVQWNRNMHLWSVWDLVVLTSTRPCSHTDHIDERVICNAVSPTKDVDGFHVVNVGRMCLDQSTMLPATPWGVWEIIKRTGNRSDRAPPPSSQDWTPAEQTIWPSEFSSFRYSDTWEECRRCRTLQECGHAHRHVTAHWRPSWEARRWVTVHDGFFFCFFFFLFVCLFFKMVGVNINGINSLIFSCRRCHGHHLSPSHSKGATSPAHSDRWYHCGCCRLVQVFASIWLWTEPADCLLLLVSNCPVCFLTEHQGFRTWSPRTWSKREQLWLTSE